MGLWIRWFGYFCGILASRNEILFVIIFFLMRIRGILSESRGIWSNIIRIDRYLWKFHSSKSPYCLRSSPFGWFESKLTRGRITMFQTVSSHSNSNKVHTHTHTIIIYEKNLIRKFSLLAICMLIDTATLIISARGSILTNEKRSQASWLFVFRCLMFLPLFIFSVFIFVWSIDKWKDFILRKPQT